MDRAETLQQLARLCRGDRDGAVQRSTISSGFTALDAALSGGGWRAGSIIELMPTAVGIGELKLLTPALAHITRAERHIALVSPPYIPYAPALDRQGVLLKRLLVIRAQNAKDILWTMEQTLRCKSFGAVLAWPSTIADRDIRRLQLAAESGDSIGFVYRPSDCALEASPAAVRLRLQTTASGLQVDVLKNRGGRSGSSIMLEERTESSGSSQASESLQRLSAFVG